MNASTIYKRAAVIQRMADTCEDRLMKMRLDAVAWNLRQLANAKRKPHYSSVKTMWVEALKRRLAFLESTYRAQLREAIQVHHMEMAKPDYSVAADVILIGKDAKVAAQLRGDYADIQRKINEQGNKNWTGAILGMFA